MTIESNSFLKRLFIVGLFMVGIWEIIHPDFRFFVVRDIKDKGDSSRFFRFFFFLLAICTELSSQKQTEKHQQ